MHPSRFWNKRIFWSGLSTKKWTHVVVKFCAQKVSVCSFTKTVFQSSQELVQMKWALAYEWMQTSRFWNRKIVWSWLSTKKVLMSLSNFARIKVSVCSFTKSILQSSQEFVQMKWGLEYECMHPSSFWNRKNFWSGLSTKTVLMSLSNFALKKVSVCSFKKSDFQSSQLLVQTEWGLE